MTLNPRLSVLLRSNVEALQKSLRAPGRHIQLLYNRLDKNTSCYLSNVYIDGDKGGNWLVLAVCTDSVIVAQVGCDRRKGHSSPESNEQYP